MIKGYWIPVLHSHLPFVKHPKFNYFLEEHWLFEAMTECYIPLLRKLKKLEKENVDFRLTISVTPPLAQMLDDKHLMQKYEEHLNNQLLLAYKESKRNQNDEVYRDVSNFYNNLYKDTKDFFINELDRNVLNGYKYFSDLGKLEVITCGATHGFLPLLSVNKKAVEVQIQLAVESHQKHFGKSPKGIWIPECAYYEGLDEILSKYGIEFFFVDSHSLVYAKPTALNGVYAPIYAPSGVAAFGRDPHSSKEVWSSKEGYSGDVNYRDFYRDIGYDLEFDYIKDHIDPSGNRCFTGFKYHKITGNSDYKEVYNPYTALEKTIAHAQDFHYKRDKQFEYLSANIDRIPVVVSPYDAELFGHWWFEGVEFLYNLFKTIDQHKAFKAITPKEYLINYPQNQMAVPQASSWGDQGYYDVWLNEGNSWIYRHLHTMANRLQNLANEYKSGTSLENTRLLNQMLRELLLAQSSDWAFLITTQTAVEYSVQRTKEHISNFFELEKMINSDIDYQLLEELEYKNSIFDFCNYKIFCSN